jgi:hypothetical protein
MESLLLGVGFRLMCALWREPVTAILSFESVILPHDILKDSIMKIVHHVIKTDRHYVAEIWEEC